MKTYGLLGLVAALTTVLIGVHGSWLWGGTILLILVWCYAIAMLMFQRPKPEPLSVSFIPGDLDNLDKLYHRAMEYCNDIINHYQTIRYTNRRYYILSQILIATLSGLTPILVLIDRDDALKAMMPGALTVALTWAMLISPGIAAVLATTSTLFKFQEEWIQSKKTAESLEAVREEFLLGASPSYQISATDAETKVLQRKKALENFIIKVNELHLDQIDRWSSSQLSSVEPSSISTTDVHVEPVPNPTGTLTSLSSIALPANRPNAPESSSSENMTNRPSPWNDEASETPAPRFSDMLSEENLRTRPDHELDLDPPQQSSVPQDEALIEPASEETYLI